MISFVVPAHNEEFWLPRSLIAIQAAAAPLKQPYEIVVVDDASTDATPRIARQLGAVVIPVTHRHIAATRNSGARSARGEILFFVDADTLISSGVIEEALDAMAQGAVGGGCVPVFEGALPWWWRVSYPGFVLGVRLLQQPGGSCMFCTRAAFERTRGFSEKHFAAEDALFASALKREGRFVVLNQPVLTSARNLRAHSGWSIGRLLLRLVLRGPEGFRNKRGLDLWYQPRREIAGSPTHPSQGRSDDASHGRRS